MWLSLLLAATTPLHVVTIDDFTAEGHYIVANSRVEGDLDGDGLVDVAEALDVGLDHDIVNRVLLVALKERRGGYRRVALASEVAGFCCGGGESLQSIVIANHALIVVVASGGALVEQTTTRFVWRKNAVTLVERSDIHIGANGTTEMSFNLLSAKMSETLSVGKKRTKVRDARLLWAREVPTLPAGDWGAATSIAGSKVWTLQSGGELYVKSAPSAAMVAGNTRLEGTLMHAPFAALELNQHNASGGFYAFWPVSLTVGGATTPLLILKAKGSALPTLGN